MKNIYIRLLQFLIGTDIDGDFGPKSEQAADKMIAELKDIRVGIRDLTRESDTIEHN